MENLRNLVGQITSLTSSKNGSTSGSNNPSATANCNTAGTNSGERQRSISGNFSSLETNQNRPMKRYKTGDQDSYYYIMWRS